MSEVNIHPSAIIETGASFGKNVKIGPFCVVGKDVTLHDNVEVKSHVVLSNKTIVGENTKIYPFAVIGGDPQNIKYHGEQSELTIGKNNIIREHVTIHTGTTDGTMKTTVGDNCFIMVGSHIAHDCEVGNNVIMANNATLGGNVKIGNYVILGGIVAVHQFVRIGEGAMISGMSGVKYDISPFAMVIAQDADIEGINVVGLKRRGFSKEDIINLKEAYDVLFDHSHSLVEAVSRIERKFTSSDAVARLITFLKTESMRGIRKSNDYYENIKA